MKQKNIKIISVILIAICLVLPNFSFASETNGAINSINKYAWSENIGWINFGCDNCNVQITDSGITGYGWSANYGWINLDPSTSGVANNGEGTLSGQAWGENADWINFSGVTIDSGGYFNGYANGTLTGDISFNCSNTNSCGSSDFKVETDWRPQSIRPACNNSLDDDDDGLIDYPNDTGCSSASDTDETNTGGGASIPVIPSTGIGKVDSYIDMGETKGGYVINTKGINFLTYINSQINFTIEKNNIQHSANIIDLDMVVGKVKIRLQSEPTIIELEIGETQQVDIDYDGQNDISIKYNELKVNRVDLTFTKILKKVNNVCGLPPEFAHGPGVAIKAPDSSKVYLISYTGEKRWIVNEEAYFTLFDSWTDVITVSRASLDRLCTGINITEAKDMDQEKKTCYLPSGFQYQIGDAIKDSNSSRIYLVANTCEKRWLVNEKAYFELFLSWNDFKHVSSEQFNMLPEGEVISASASASNAVNKEATENSTLTLEQKNNICSSDIQFTVFLSKGSTGEQVGVLQELLKCLGHFPLDIEPTRYYGPVTFESVKKFQLANNIDAVGYVGPITRAKLNEMFIK
ncbi:MAG: peptidoglycan-binding protein [Bacteroidales bacterium]|nr:peptidoglycan-binding protein [Bacteroidales bacterium]